MKKIILSCFVSLCMSANAQIKLEVIQKKIGAVSAELQTFCDSVSSEIETANSTGNFMTDGSYKKFVDQQFTNLSYNRGVLPTGNSAALELKNNSTQIDLSLSQKKQRPGTGGSIVLFTEGIKAKFNNDISQLFGNGKISTGTTFYGNFAFLPAVSRSNKHIKAVVAEIDIDGEIKDLAKDLRDRRSYLVNEFCETYTTEYIEKYKAMLECLKLIRDSISSTQAPCNLTLLIRRKEDLQKQLMDAGLLTSTSKKIVASAKKQYFDKMYDIEAEDDSWLWTKFFWWSGGITYTRDAYDTYDESKPLAKRFDSKTFDAVGVTVAVHWLKEYFGSTENQLFGSRYLNLSFNAGSSNSFARISNLDILRSINRSGPDTIYSFQSNKKAKNITGKKYDTNWEYTFRGTFTGMFGKKQNAGLNFRPEWNLSKLSKPVYSTHLGVIMRFTNNNFDPSDKKSKSKINVEAFLELNDLTDVGGSGKNVWQNKVIGLGTTVPFANIFFK